MSIVESAIGKARQAQRAIAARSSRSATVEPDRPAPRRVDPPPRQEPAERIPALSVMVDTGACREQRVLLPDASEKDGVAIAAYRMLRTRVLHRARAKQWTTIGITSPEPGDGKTLTAINFSLSLAAEQNSDVVLLDLDMRNPSVMRTLGITPVRELRDVFEGRSHVEDVFLGIGVENFLVAGSIRPTDRASELLGTTHFEELIAYIKRRTSNALVVIDLPPVNVTDDTLVIAPRVDTLLLVASEGKTSRAGLAHALKLLQDFTVAGIVLNRAVQLQQYYSYGYRSDRPWY